MRFVILGNVLVVTHLLCGSAHAQDADTTPDTAARERLDYMYESAAGFSGKRTADGAELKIFETPLLRFTNPLHGCREGLFVAWVDPMNRPVAVGQVFLMPNTENNWYIETQSVADYSLELRSTTNGIWAPRDAGINWVKFKSETLEAASSKTRRLSQMRRLARRFRVEDDLVDEGDVLRLMVNPMIRYSDPESGVIDGALFAFVQGTDPELLVQLEARESGNGKREFYWALAAMTSAAVNAYLDEDHVWSKERSAGGPNEVFYMRPLTGGVPYPSE